MVMTDSANGRIRINVSTSVKGVVTCEFTVEVGDASQEQMNERIKAAWDSVDMMSSEKAERFSMVTDA